MAKCNQGDFSWDDDDLDVDLLLGEYEFGENENDPVLKVKEAKCVYQCPQCDKEYRSISGFRGHVLKKHDMNLKANNYKKTASAQKCTQEQQADQDENDRFEEVFPAAYTQSCYNLSNDPLYNFLCDSNMKIAQCCQSDSVKSYFNSVMKKCFDSQRYATSGEREVLMKRVHCVRTNASVIEQGVQILKENLTDFEVVSDLDIEGFIQDMTMDLLGEMFKQRIQLEQKTSSENIPMTETDNKVLFYISGYLIRSLTKKYSKNKNKKDRETKLDAVNGLTNTCSETTFTKQFSSWFEKKDRGGLKKPSDNMFFLIREFENVARKFDDLPPTELKENIIDSFMVGHYHGELFPVSSEDDIDASSTYIEDMVNLFITIRGFARARLLQRKVVKDKTNEKQEKSSASLRTTLKNISNSRQ